MAYRGSGSGGSRGGGGLPFIWPPPPPPPPSPTMDGYRGHMVLPPPSPAAIPSSTAAQSVSTSAYKPAAAAAASSTPLPAALAMEMRKKLFAALVPPAAAAQGMAPALAADDAADFDQERFFEKRLAHPARLGLATVGKKVLREERRKHIGDTGRLDHLQKHMTGRVPEGSIHQLHRRHNTDGAMEYWLEPAELAEGRQAGVSDLCWVPPPGWKPGDDVSLVTGDLLVKRQVEVLNRQMEQLMCKDNEDFDAERAYHSLQEKYQRPVRANEKLENEVCCLKEKGVGSGNQIIPRRIIQGSQYRPVRKSSFPVCKPGTFFRGFSTSRPDTSDLNPLFDVIGPVRNTVHWPLNGSLLNLQTAYNECIGSQRLYHYVHGVALDVSTILGPNRTVFTTSRSGTQYVDVSYLEDGTHHHFTLVVDAREGWNYCWQNENGTFEYQNSLENPYVVEGHTIHVNFLSDYSEDGLCPLGHGSTLLGPEPVKVACKILSGYTGKLPAPPQVQMACAIFINYLIEAVKFHDIHHVNSESLISGSLCTLDDVDPVLSPLMKKWSKLSKPQMDFLIRRLHFPSTVPLWRVDGIQNLHPMVNAVAVRPFNTTTKQGTNKRIWTCYPKDEDADGVAHPLSLQYIKRWPHHPKVLLPEKRICNVSAVVANTKDVDLTSPKFTNLMEILKRAGSHHLRSSMSRHTFKAINILSWLKKGL